VRFILKNILLRLGALLLLLSLALTLFGCTEPAPKKQSHAFYGCFGPNLPATLTDYSGMAESEFNSLCARLEEQAILYHKLFDIYNSYESDSDGRAHNNIKVINDRSGEPVKVCRELFDFLLYAKELYTLTEGRMNIAMGAVLRLWHEKREAGRGKPNAQLPDAQALAEAKAHTDINKLVLDEDTLTVTLLDKEMSLDVGAVGKGYAALILKGMLEEAGATSFVINLAGNLTAVGERPDGNGWRTGIQKADVYGSAEYYGYFTLKNSSCSTSGDYENYYYVDGKRYHHIINPDTLYPDSYYRSVTVVSDNPALTDAFSTALFTLPIEQSQALAEKLQLRVLWVLSDESIVKTDGFE